MENNNLIPDELIWRNQCFRATRQDALDWQSQPEHNKKKWCARYLYMSNSEYIDDEIIRDKQLIKNNIPCYYNSIKLEYIKRLEDKLNFWLRQSPKENKS